ncbi:MAG: hypothetical protein HQ515_08505, partial [Phycisphaeraceae bacterium]|nr:hypothetical protein [Phycisphaeraceae bacterium]
MDSYSKSDGGGGPKGQNPRLVPKQASLVRFRALRQAWHTFSERTMVTLIHLSGVSAIVFVFCIFYFVFREGAPFLWDNFDIKGFFCSEQWYPTSELNKRYGILALLAGTGGVTVVATLISVPFGLGVAIFIAKFCGKKSQEALKILVELLAAVPSVVWGFIG